VYCFLNGFLQKICVVILFCSLAVLDGWTQQTTAFKPLGTLSWLKRNVISHTEKLNTKKYNRKAISRFVPRQNSKIVKQKANFFITKVAGKFTPPKEQSISFIGRSIKPLQIIAAPGFLFRDNSLFNITYTDKAHGFLTDGVIAIAEDSDQNIWIATAAMGLIKYDGNNYYVYNTECGLISNSFTDLKFEKNTGLCLATSEGIQILRNDSVFVPQLVNEKNENLNVAKINFDKRNNVWVNTLNKGSFRFDFNHQRVQHFDTSCGLPFNLVHHVVQDGKNKYWFGGVGLARIDGIHITQWFTAKDYINDDQCLSLLEDEDTLWVGTFDKLIYKISPTDTSRFLIGNIGGRVFDMIKSKGAIWFTSYGQGLYYLKGDDYLFFNEKNGLSGRGAYHLMQDTYGNIWISTLSNGISRLNESSIITDNNAPAFLHNASAIKKDAEGHVWYFLNGGGIVIEKPGGYELITNQAQTPLPQVRHFMDGIINSDGTAWLASYTYGIAHYDKKEFSFYYYSDDPVARVLLDAAMEHNNTAWFSTMNFGLVYCRNHHFYRLTKADGLFSDSNNFLETDKEGALLCLSEMGIQKVSNDTIYNIYLNGKPYTFSSACIYTTLKGDYLIGTYDKGLLMIRNNTLYQLNSKNKMDYQAINGITADSAGTLWLSSEKGITRATLNGLTFSNIKFFDAGNGLMLSKINHIGYTDGQGIPHWSTDNSFLKYEPDLENTGSLVPALKFLNATVNGAEVGIKKTMAISPDDELNLYYSAICWGHENQLKIKYALISKNQNDTIELLSGEKGSIKIHNLGTGDYSLVLIAGIGNTKYYSRPLHLTVSPYWYNTQWFYALCALLMGAVFFLFFHYRSLRLQKAKQLLEQMVAERTADLTNSLGERNILLKEIHHRVKNNLQVISGLLELQKDETIDEKVKAALSEGQSRVRSVALIHHNLYQHENLASIHFKLFVSDLVRYLGEVFEEKSKKMIVDVIGEDAQLDIDTAVPLGLIINELLTNAYKYGAPDDGVATVLLELKKISAAQYQLTYKDNGPGIKGEIKFDSATSLGLRLIKGLIVQIGGTVTYSYNSGSVFIFVFKNGEARRKEQ
jgi:two-component sensor histidine kinase/ligand-binding sensor domain-containing protein